MTIISKGYFNEVIPGEVAANIFTLAASNRFWCYNQDSVEVTPVGGGTREVQISTGQFGAQGIYNDCTVAETVQLPAPVAGTQWYMISATHEWADGASATTFEALHCGSVAQVPAGFVVNPGTPDFKVTQPLAYVPITFGDTIPGTPIDLRLMGTAGGSMSVNSLEALTYYGYLGQEIWFGKTRYSRILNPGGNSHSWIASPGPFGTVALTEITVPQGASASGWTTNNGTPGQTLPHSYIKNGNEVDIHFEIRRTGGNITVSDGSVTDTLMFVLNEGWRPHTVCPTACLYINTGGSNTGGLITVHPNGNVTFVAGEGNRSLASKTSGYSVSAHIKFTLKGA